MSGLIILSVLAALAGALSLSNATMGVGILCGAVLLAIFARIAQAGRQHNLLMKALRVRAFREFWLCENGHDTPIDADGAACATCGASLKAAKKVERAIMLPAV